MIFALIAGLLIAIQQALNGQVSATSGSPFVAGLGNFVVGFVGLSFAVLIYQLVAPHQIGQVPSPLENPWIYVGGFIGPFGGELVSPMLPELLRPGATMGG